MLTFIDSQKQHEQKKAWAAIKGRNSSANLRKMVLYNPNVDLVNDSVYTKFG